MFVKASIVFRHVGCPSENLPDGIAFAQISGGGGRDLGVLTGPDDGSLDDVLEACENTLGVTARILYRAPGCVIYWRPEREDGIASLIRAEGCFVLWPATFSGGFERYHVLAPDRKSLSAVVARLREHGSVSQLSVANVPADNLGVMVPVAALSSGLTSRQLAAVRSAFERGYYDSPRRVTLERLAQDEGVSPSTLSEHLRKGERAVLEEFFRLVDEVPSLAAGALKRPGRPPAVR